MRILFVIVYIELLPLFMSTEAKYGLPKCNPLDPPVRRNINIDDLITTIESSSGFVDNLCVNWFLDPLTLTLRVKLKTGKTKDIHTTPNNFSKLKGRWFHGTVTTPKTLPPLLLRVDFNYDIIGGGIMVINGRLPRFDEDLCMYETLQLKELPNQRSLTYTSYWKWGGTRIDFRILDTDYKTYAVFWSCSQITDGKCTDHFTLISSKDVNGLSPRQLRSLNPMLKETICSTITDFKDWPLRPEKVCPRKDIFNVEVIHKSPNSNPAYEKTV